MNKKQKLSFAEMLALEREEIRQNPELMDKIEQKLEDKLTSSTVETAED
ncbi:Fur-regulated basic protein B [Salinibacillus kushneri]|uniref:Fur-regulated basic protein B n=1 Tax=Salinibacillus kushneri TaxID=237682 RepID=A0A1I0DZU2_9BACI|nr:FbpB family small basic protein [Salinibacillus kushneri]SET38282.1 Fur-regulated basic protein B [Salinibacillus kushneri]